MLIALIARDKPGALETRLANREAHLAYAADSGVTVKYGGPMLDDQGQMCLPRTIPMPGRGCSSRSS